MTIDLSGEPESIDPAIAYAPRDWSIVHSIYDSLVQFGPNGEIVPLAAETFTFSSPTTIDITLRQGVKFHDGSPLDTKAITRTVQHLNDSNSMVKDLFTVITKVDEIDDLHAQITLSSPAAWLPAQMVAWFALLPDGFTPDSLVKAPIGTGPYTFREYKVGSEITLDRNDDYTWGSPKGNSISDSAVYRFVSEPATRVADLATGSADIIIEIPEDQKSAIESNGATAVEASLVGSAWIRLISDQKPFDDARVRQALNYAVDVQSI
ncbi:MAG TPA: ABC transporter substrate-binding protein, partial [Thermomicrobiales bacterium]|nr:ABC transporter substrate-binding protein [Thermomicrobiales bacterium]